MVRSAIDKLPDLESEVDARLREAGLLAPPRDDDDLPRDASPESWDALERELDELLAETGPLHRSEVVIEDRR